MTICHEVKCVGCGKMFHATYEEDVIIPEKCPTCDPPVGDFKPQPSSGINSMGPLIVPDKRDLLDWDAG